MFNENSNCFMDKSLDSLTVQWTYKLFDGKTAWFPTCSMNIQIVSWTNLLIPNMFNEHANCYGKITWFPKCSMIIQIVWLKKHVLPWILNENSKCLDKSQNFLNDQWAFTLFDGKITDIPTCPMKIQIAWWANLLIP